VSPAFEGLPQQELAHNQIMANVVALALSNMVAYVTNVLWVFTGGRHNRWIEFGLFTLVNAVSGLAGIFAGPFLRVHLPIGWTVAQAALIITSTLVNFVCRKFLVFQR
jgi:putative flippase GtrA